MTDLDRPEMWSALVHELDGTFGLLRAADRALADFRVGVLDIDPLFALLAPGTERLLKIVHGLAVLDATGEWPSKSEMAERLRHRIVDLEQLCRVHVRTALPRATAPPYIGGLLKTVESDRTLTAMLEALTRYASSGRFHNLDTLAESPPGQPPPRQLWKQLEQELIEQRPDLLAGLGTVGGWETARAWMNQQCRVSLHDWQVLYVRAGMHGCFGDRGKRWLSAYMPPPLGSGAEG